MSSLATSSAFSIGTPNAGLLTPNLMPQVVTSLDAAYDAAPRDLKENRVPVAGLSSSLSDDHPLRAFLLTPREVFAAAAPGYHALSRRVAAAVIEQYPAD